MGLAAFPMLGRVARSRSASRRMAKPTRTAAAFDHVFAGCLTIAGASRAASQKQFPILVHKSAAPGHPATAELANSTMNVPKATSPQKAERDRRGTFGAVRLLSIALADGARPVDPIN